MITRLLPEQISKHWDVIKFAIESSLPPTIDDHPDKMNRILSSALSGGITVWVSHTIENEVNNFEGIGLTKFLYDDSSGTKSMLMYCMYGFNKIADSSWPIVMDSLVKFAKSRNCSKILAYSSIPYMVQRSKELGANTDYTFISFPLDN